MKKSLLTVCCIVLIVSTLFAQRKLNDARPHFQNNDIELTILANRSERFTVYIDGIPQSNSSVNRCVVYDMIPNEIHDVAVVVERPIRYLLYTEVNLSPGKYEMEVYADNRDNYAELYFTNERPVDRKNHINTRHHYGSGQHVISPTHPVPPPPLPQEPRYCSESDMSVIISTISQEPFDDTRLKYLKIVTVAKQPFLVDQIKRIAEKFTFDTRRIEYIKYAYNYCFDIDNYFTLTDLFVHRSDKEKLLKFIQENQRK